MDSLVKCFVDTSLREIVRKLLRIIDSHGVDMRKRRRLIRRRYFSKVRQLKIWIATTHILT